MPSKTSMRICRLGLVPAAAVGLLSACGYWNVPRAGNIQSQVQMPGRETGSVAYAAQMSAVSPPAISAAYTCVNSVEKACYGAPISQGTSTSLTVPLVDGGNNTTVSSYVEFSQLQPGSWDIDVHLTGTAQKDIKICGVRVAASKKTILTILPGRIATSASYQIGNGAATHASICQ